jgi:hypothetical protein
MSCSIQSETIVTDSWVNGCSVLLTIGLVKQLLVDLPVLFGSILLLCFVEVEML